MLNMRIILPAVIFLVALNQAECRAASNEYQNESPEYEHDGVLRKFSDGLLDNLGFFGNKFYTKYLAAYQKHGESYDDFNDEGILQNILTELLGKLGLLNDKRSGLAVYQKHGGSYDDYNDEGILQNILTELLGKLGLLRYKRSGLVDLAKLDGAYNDEDDDGLIPNLIYIILDTLGLLEKRTALYEESAPNNNAEKKLEDVLAKLNLLDAYKDGTLKAIAENVKRALKKQPKKDNNKPKKDDNENSNEYL